MVAIKKVFDFSKNAIYWIAFCSFLLVFVSKTLLSQTTLYYNANIFTSDTAHPFVSFMLVQDGKIVDTGSNISYEAIRSVENSIDMHGKTIIPGIVDSHIHFIDGALGMLQISLSDVLNSDELSSRIVETSSQLLDGYYVGRDLGFLALSDQQNPRLFLDQVLPDVPIVLFMKSGHAAIANTEGLKKLGFHGSTKIADGTLEKDADGNLKGWLLEGAAMEALKRVGAKYTDKTIMKAISKAQEVALSYGITTIGDNTFAPYHMKIYQAMQRDGSLHLRVWTRSYGRISQTTSLMKPMGTKKLGLIGPANDFDQVHFHLIKLFEDMSLSVPKGVVGSIEPGGTIFLDKNEIKQYLLLQPEDKFAFHVQGKRGLQNILDAMNDLGARNHFRRHVIDHAGYCSENQLKEIHRLGSSVTILADQSFDYPTLLRDYNNSGFNLQRDDLLNARLKYQLCRGALTSDYPYGMDTAFLQYPYVDGLNPFPNMAANVSGRMPDGTQLEGFQSKTLTVQQAVISYTANGAFVLGEEDKLGKIAPGYAADFLVLDQNIFKENPMDLYHCRVDQTYINGKKVYDSKQGVFKASDEHPTHVSPYDYTVSPVFGYDPSTGFVFGGAAFVYPLKTPASYGDVQLMATAKGKIQLQAKYMRYSLFRNIDFELPVTLSSFPQYFFGEGDTTKARFYQEIFSDRYFARPSFNFHLPNHFMAALFGDFRARHENEVINERGQVVNHQLFGNEKDLGIGLSLQYDTRNNPQATKLGFYAKLFYEQIPDWSGNKGQAGLFGVDMRYFHYIYSADYVIAARLACGSSFGDLPYLYRYVLGGGEMLRGYYSNRFRGDYFYALQTEFRFPLYKRFSGVCFLDEGDVGDNKLSQILVSYGGGIRFSINDNVTLRLDYGKGKDQSGVFFTFGEAF